MAHDVFISYSTKDKTIADAVCAMLEEKKIRCWIAPRDVPAGKNFAESIIEAIDICKVFVLIWSSNTNTSEHILNEINRAFDQGITIIPFRIEDVQPTRAMSYYFGRTHWLDAITPPLEKHIAILAESIYVNFGAAPESKPEPEPIKIETAHEEPKVEKIRPQVKPQAKAPIHSVIEKEKIEEIRPESTIPRKKLNPLPIAAGVVVVTLIALLFSGVFKGSTPSKDLEISEPTALSTLRAATSTSILTQPDSTAIAKNAEPAAQPTMLSNTISPTTPWVKDFAEPILASIKNREPDFQDDFSTIKPDWKFCESVRECPNTKVSITDGKLHIIAEPECSDKGTCIAGPFLQKNFVIQVDAISSDYLQLSPAVTLTTMDDSGLYYFHLFDGQKLNWRLFYVEAGGYGLGGGVEQQTGYTAFDQEKPVTIIIIFRENEYAIFLNGIPITYSNNLGKELRNSLLLGTIRASGIQNWGTVTADFDNLKVWDLDKIEKE